MFGKGCSSDHLWSGRNTRRHGKDNYISGIQWQWRKCMKHVTCRCIGRGAGVHGLWQGGRSTYDLEEI
jgi:hypothetical protein